MNNTPAQVNVSIVMVSYHTGPVLFDAIEHALLQEGLHELIIIDNGNPNEVRNRLRKQSDTEPMLKYITGHGNVGFATGCNLGATQATGDYLLFLNPDCILPPQALTHAVLVMQADAKAWLAGCCICDRDGKPEQTNTRNLLSLEVCLSEVFRLWRWDAKKFPRINIIPSEHEETPYYVPAISGAFMLIRRKRYQDLGGMDQEYFFHVEDLDFCREINVQGGKVLYIPAIKPVHHRSSSDVSSFFVEWHKTKGFIRYFKKHYRHTNPTLAWIMTFAIIGRLVLRTPKVALWQLRRRAALAMPENHKTLSTSPTPKL